ncbi:MAG TPA: FAD binding domain-containing protein [Polyangia bacterium]|jgi:xanthine dehydrogenase small subunit|nr:FAD binding domain-containing protein [Polyangia bacterium]
MAVSFVLNGQKISVGPLDHHTTLLAWLRARGLTGSKEGCAEGECGACAVALLRPDAGGGARLDPVNGCLLPVVALAGQSVVTVEGIAEPSGVLHPVQRLMAEAGGSQCGYCTPGFVVSLACEYYRPGRAGYDPEAISGNLCRCTGYRPIVDAARALPPVPAGDPRARQLAAAPPALAAVVEPRFARPTDLASLWAACARLPDAAFMAGGTDQMVYVNQRDQRFPALIALEAVAELRGFETGPGQISIGAALTLAEVEDRLARAGVAAETGMLHQLFPLFSSRLIRNRATLGGNLATASPIGDAPPALLALDAEVTLVGAAGARRVALADFFVDYRRTVLARGEVIAAVHLPRPLPAVQRFYKVSKRVLDDISTVAGAFALDLTPEGRVARLRIAFGGVAPTPLRARAAEARATGLPWTRETVTALLPEIDAAVRPIDDHRGSAAYRRRIAGRLLEKFWVESAGARG